MCNMRNWKRKKNLIKQSLKSFFAYHTYFTLSLCRSSIRKKKITEHIGQTLFMITTLKVIKSPYSERLWGQQEDLRIECWPQECRDNREVEKPEQSPTKRSVKLCGASRMHFGRRHLHTDDSADYNSLEVAPLLCGNTDLLIKIVAERKERGKKKITKCFSESIERT